MPLSSYSTFRARGLMLFGLSDIFGTQGLYELSMMSLKKSCGRGMFFAPINIVSPTYRKVEERKEGKKI